MKWYVITFENEKEILNLKPFVLKTLKENKYTFVDREYQAGHRLRIRGIDGNIDTIISQIKMEERIYVTEESVTAFFENTEQFLLNCEIHHELDLFWFPYYFEKKILVEKVIKNAEMIAENLTIYDEGYNSHISHFWGFFISLENNEKREGILQYFADRYCSYRNSDLNEEGQMIDVVPYLEKVEKLTEKNKINFYSPSKVDDLLREDRFASKLHKRTAENAKQDQFFLSKNCITNRWYLNALYVAMILMKLPVIDRYFLNYCIAQKMYEVDRSCREYIRTGEERIWMRK